jgi:hypothetical protein
VQCAATREGAIAARQPCCRIPVSRGLRPVALRPTLSDGLPFSSGSAASPWYHHVCIWKIANLMPNTKNQINSNPYTSTPFPRHANWQARFPRIHLSQPLNGTRKARVKSRAARAPVAEFSQMTSAYKPDPNQTHSAAVGSRKKTGCSKEYTKCSQSRTLLKGLPNVKSTIRHKTTEL